MRVPLSVLDLSPVSAGRSRRDALDDSLRLAVMAEESGYKRYWLGEHHGSKLFMASATSLLLARAAEHTSSIRLGAGGVMLPNHSPLMVAEYYGTLATVYGDRFDLGVGRAPGTDPVTANALRRGSAHLSDFAADVVDLAHYLEPSAQDDPGMAGAEVETFGFETNPASLRSRILAIPGEGTRVPLWMLGSTLGGAGVAASLGLPYGFASHFAPQFLRNAAATYRVNFNASAPTAQVERPYLMAGVNVMVAPTEREARFLFSSFAKWRSEISRDLNRPLSKPDEAWVSDAPMSSAGVVGTPEQAVEFLDEFVEQFKLDELIVVSYAWDPQLRRRSYRLLAEAWAERA
ncbi:MAG: LLM class flavin-dependent oxidoreductase [Actinomycetaceae bacterium]|nr:LLM class flavin-dependent oxidoreductase [Actinomycetaceae bacterium]